MIPFLIMLVSAGASIGTVSQEPANTCPSWGAPIHVHVHGIRNAHGTVKAVLYGPEPETFLVKGKKADREREPAEEGSMTLCVAAPEIGQYAVVVYHDENDNHKFDRNWIGLPIEGFGVSNDPPYFWRLQALKRLHLRLMVNSQTLKLKSNTKENYSTQDRCCLRKYMPWQTQSRLFNSHLYDPWV